MSSDLRRQTREIKEALSRFEHEHLVEILTHVFRQYVIDGVAPPPASLTGQDELSGLSFPQLIERLQLRLDLPELRLFEVQAGRVMVRVEGRLVPVETADARPEPLPVARVTHVHTLPSAPAPAPAPASPGTQVREVAAAPGVAPIGHSGSARPDGTARSQGRPAAPPAPGPAAAPAPSAPSRPAAPAGANAPSPAAGAAPANPARPEKPAAPEKDKNDNNGARFSLLEID